MTDFDSHRTPKRYARLFIVTVIMVLVLAMTAAAAPAQEQTADEPYPTDAEVVATLEPVILSESRRGDVKTITVEIPAGADTFTTSSRPNQNWSNDPNLRVGFNLAQSNGAERIFIFFPTTSIPSNATVHSARLRALANSFSPNGDAPMGLSARFLNSSWDASTLTWANYNPAWGAEIGVGQNPAAVGWTDADITGPVREWVSGARANFGLMIQGDETPQQRERVFTALNANDGNHPRIVVTYDVIVDTTPPTSSMTALPQWSPGTFNVNWTGSDNPGGTGIRHFDVQVRTNGGAWQNWQTATTATSASYTGQNGVLYEFRVRAVDNANNFGAFPNNPQAATTVDTVPPSVSMNPLPQFTFSKDFVVTWSGTDNLSGIAYYDVEFQENGGGWQFLTSETPQTSHQVLNATPDFTYGFRARAVDQVGNVQPFADNAQAHTTISLGEPQAVIRPFNPGIATQSAFMVQWDGAAAPGSTVVSYDLQVSFNGGPWQNWLTNFGGTNAEYTAAQGDGVYAFQVRARDSQGRVGQFESGLATTIAVDAVAPFLSAQTVFPVITKLLIGPR